MDTGGDLANIFDQAVFAIGGVALAWLILRARKEDMRSNWPVWSRHLLPAGMLACLLVSAWVSDRGVRLSAQADRFSMPADMIPDDGEEVLLFRVADRASHGDLVVRPYLQDHLNRIALAEDPRVLIEIHGRKVPGSDGIVQAKVVIRDHPGNAADERPGMHLTFGEEAPLAKRTDGRVQPLMPGNTTRVHIYRDDMTGTDNLRYRPRRFFSVSNLAPVGDRAGRITIVLDQPMRSDAGGCLIPRDVLVPAPLEGSPEPGFRNPRNLEFGALGQGGHKLAVMGGRSIGPAPERENRCAADQNAVTWPSEEVDDRTSLQLKFVLVNLPWLHVWLLAAASIATIVLGSAATRAERILMPALLFLLMVRSMVAIAAAFYDPRVAASLWYADAAAAIIALPPLLAALIRPATSTFRSEWLAWLGLTVILIIGALMWFNTGGFGRPEWIVIVAALVMLVLRATWPDISPASLVFNKLLAIARSERFSLGLTAKMEWLKAATTGGPLASWMAHLLLPLRESRVLRISFLALLVMGFGRIALAVLGSFTGLGLKERIFGIAVSTPYLLMLFSAIAAGVLALFWLERGKRAGALWLGIGIGVAGFLGPRMVNDTGFILVHMLPICAVAAWYGWRASATLRQKAVIAAMCMLPAFGFVLILLSSAGIALSQLDDLDAPLAERMSASLEISANDLRLIQLMEPEAVEAVGTAAAYAQMDQTAMIHSLTGNVWGRGWLRPLELLSIRKEQSMDYVAAVHLMFPFGRFGAVVFLGVMSALLAALVLPSSVRAIGGKEEDHPYDPFLGIVGKLSTWTLFAAAAYMVLCNLLLIPFTGRNIYLLAVRSGGDMIEAVMLLALAGLALREVRQ